MRITCAVLAVCAAATPALADDSLLRVDRSMRWEGAFGIRVGSFHVGPFDGTGFGFHGDAGVRFDRLNLYGEYSFLTLSNDPPRDSDTAALGTSPPADSTAGLEGIAHRVGVTARYSFARIANDEVPLRGDFWFEAGTGEELIRWDRGGELHRPDLALGFGGQFTARFGKWHDHHAGVYYALRATFAHAPAGYANLPPTCAGPCDTPTRPLGIDRSFLFNLGIVFGD